MTINEVLPIINKSHEVKTIYKYRRFDDYSLRLLSHNEIYFAPRDQFNDPFEVNCYPKYDHSNYQQILNIYTSDLEESEYFRSLSETQQDIVRAIKHNAYKENPDKEIEIANNTIKGILEKVRVCSFSADNWNNHLMWGHYSDKCTGFCVGYNYNEFARFIWKYYKHSIWPLLVEYGNLYPKLNPLIIDSDFDTMYRCLAYKSDTWSYENELRLVMFNYIYPVFKIPIKYIESVTFGVNIKQENREKIIDILRNRGLVIKVYQLAIIPDSFDYGRIEILY